MVAHRTRLAAWAAAAVLATPLAGCGVLGIGESDDGRTTIEFFQFKSEAIGTFDRLIAEFEREHPDIRVQQNHVPDADTAIRTRMVREDIPDVMTLNANATFGELASAGVFYDFAAEPAVREVNPAILQIINDLGTGGRGEVNGIPFANNADGVIYNKDLFAEHGVEVPTTWDELIRTAETFADAGVTPFYLTLKEAWTTLPAFNALASNLAPPDFFDRLEADEASFTDAYEPVAERLYQLFQFGQDDRFARDYYNGNTAFAEGEAAMYLQGSWAVPVIRSFKPDFEIGVFAMPMDDAAETRLVSGVDVALTMGRDPEHKAESLAFINFLLRRQVVEGYAEEQSAVPALRGSVPSDPALEGVVRYVEQGRLVGFADHHIPPSIPLAPLNQQYLIDGDRAAYLSALDDEWDKVARRRS